MLLEALEILQSAGEDANTYVTDFALYKVVSILTIYTPFFVATFLLSQEYLGQKIACFAPPNFTSGQAGALNEYCWNQGLWLQSGSPRFAGLLGQPHCFYALYLAVQALICTSPLILWNVITKAHLLAILRGTEEFLEDLVDLITKGRNEGTDPSLMAAKVKGQLRQFHAICLSAARESHLSVVTVGRQVWELTLFLTLLVLQGFIYNFWADKEFTCLVPQLSSEHVMCTVPILDLLDFIWMLNVTSLTVAMATVLMFIQAEVRCHFGSYQPMFINDLPFGDRDDFNEHIQWDSNITKHSYELLTMIYEENATIMTQVYILNALKPLVDGEGDGRGVSNTGPGGEGTDDRGWGGGVNTPFSKISKGSIGQPSHTEGDTESTQTLTQGGSTDTGIRRRVTSTGKQGLQG